METKNEIDIFKVATPIDVIKQSLGKEVFVKCKFNRELKGKLHVNNKYMFLILIIQAYDVHLNLLLSEVEETNIENKEKRNMDLIYIRGDLVILISPLI